MFTGVLNGNLGDTYVNTEKSKSTITVPSYTNIQITNVLNARPLEGYYNSGFVSSTLIYNRALTPQEVLQNYNATKRRFGL
jgi:7,8-dihydro-6-hydroxymethylpterin-pyrophosphokinase